MRRLPLPFCVWAAACALSACGRYELAATWNELRGDAYALDAISRDLAEGAAPSCPAEVATVMYRGEVIAYQTPVRVAVAFVPKLRTFERVVSEVAQAHYGRAPDRVLHFGTRACRSVRGSGGRLSEHALSNAMDLSGFEWQRTAATRASASTPAFRVTIQKHWKPADSSAEAARHAQFLHALVDRIVSDDVFRGVIGPGREGHANHLHLDQAPWSYVLF